MAENVSNIKKIKAGAFPCKNSFNILYFSNSKRGKGDQNVICLPNNYIQFWFKP